MVIECFYHEKGSDSLTNKHHMHENCYEIIQTLSQNGNFMIKDTLYPIDHGTIFLINAIDLHCSVPENVAEYSRNKIAMNSHILDSVAALLGCSDMVYSLFRDNNCAAFNLGLSEIEQVDALFYDIFKLYEENEPTKRMELYSKILRLLQFCYDNHKEKTQKISDCVSRTLTYINNNISHDISLDEISSNLFINKSYLCRQFKKATNMTIVEYIYKRRLSMAKKKLQFTNLSISDIAFICGFSSFSHFSNFFKKCEGVTPSHYREKYKN